MRRRRTLPKPQQSPGVSAVESQPFALQAEAAVTIVAAEAGKPAPSPKVELTAYTGCAMNVGYAPWPVVIDVAGVKPHGPRTPLLLDHDRAQIVGQADSVEITAKTIKLSGVITGDISSEDTPAGFVVGHARRGFVWPASVGVSPTPGRVEYVSEGQTVKVNGSNFTGPLYVVRAGTLGEVSFVAWGADGKSTTKIAASAASAENTMKTFEAWLKAKGIDAATLTEPVKTTLKAAYDAEQVEDEPAPAPAPKPAKVVEAAADDPVATFRANMAAESERIRDIVRECGKQWPELEASAVSGIQASAIKDGWSLDKTRAELQAKSLESVRAGRANNVPFAIHANAGVDVTDDVRAAAVCQSLRLPDTEKQFKPEVLQAAQTTFKARLGLGELILRAAHANGYDRNAMRITTGNLRSVLKAAFSTASISGILSNVANKVALAAFLAVDQAWREISSRSIARDFKTTTHYRLNGALEYEEVAPTGKIKDGSLTDENWTNQAKTYAKRLAITRNDLVNDDLGALQQVPRMMGRGAALKLNNVFWATFLNNSSFFTSARGNYTEGAATNLSLTSLDAVELLFRQLKDATNAYLGLTPRILLVPNAIIGLAETIFRSSEYRDTTASTKFATANRWAARLRPVTAPYLSDSAFTGYSTTAWYMLADPADLATIDVAFLDGQESPVIETADADFDELGIQVRGYHDFGCSLAEYLAGVKSKGAA